MKYQVGKQWWFNELGRKPDAGEIVELDEAVAERYMHNEPGLLIPVRHNTQARPSVVRQDKPKTRTPRKRR
jgi:hypothetical protein